MRRTLRGRLVAAFTGVVLLVTAVCGLSAAAFLYASEDRFFESLLAEEAARLEAGRAATGRWETPRHGWMTVHATPATLPDDLAASLLAAPRRQEFPGAAGRHYHVRPLARAAAGAAAPPAWLVAEVGDRLVIRPMRGDLLRRWLVVQGVLTGLAVLLALALARRIARPLTALADAVGTLDPAAPGPIALPRAADRELATVTAALDGLQRRVAAFVEREQGFTRDVSHELRTPLAVIRASAAQALDEPTLPPATRRMVERSLRAALGMTHTVDSLLALAREARHDSPRSPTAVRPLVEAVVLEEWRDVDAARLSLSVTVPDEATLPAPPAVLRLVLGNVLRNAAQHAAPGVVAVRMEGHTLVVENALAAGSLPDVATLGAAGVRGERSPGYGLGLELSRRLCARSGLALELHTDGARTFGVRIGAAPERRATASRNIERTWSRRSAGGPLTPSTQSSPGR